jgi:thiol-disulfide isomerase/thioredoxin
MDPLLALAVLAAVVLGATGFGLALRRSTGRARRGRGIRVSSHELGTALDGSFGTEVTLLQFSTEMCARCPGTRRLLRAVAADHDDVSHAEVDLTRRPDLASRFQILQTPTTLILDREGAVTSRIGGAPRRDQVVARIEELIGR